MRVFLRHESQEVGSFFCEIQPSEEALNNLVKMLNGAGGVIFDDAEGHIVTEWQFCLDRLGAYVEIVLEASDG